MTKRPGISCPPPLPPVPHEWVGNSHFIIEVPTPQALRTDLDTDDGCKAIWTRVRSCSNCGFTVYATQHGQWRTDKGQVVPDDCYAAQLEQTRYVMES